MRTIFAEYNPHRNSIDIYTSAGYMLRIDCWEAEKDLKTTPGSDCALNAAFAASIMRGFIAISIFAFALSAAFGMTGVWLAFPAAEFVTMFVIVKGLRQLKL